MSWYATMVAANSMYQENADQATQGASDAQAEGDVSDGMGMIMGLGSNPVGALEGMGVLASSNTGGKIGAAAYQAEMNHNLDAWANSWGWSKYWRQVRSGTEGTFGKFYYENRAGGAVGRQVGGAIGWVVGLFAPALGPLFTSIFGELGSILGTVWQGADYRHPDVEGAGGPADEEEAYVPAGHDPQWFVETTPATPSNPFPYIEAAGWTAGMNLGRISNPIRMEANLAKLWHYM